MDANLSGWRRGGALGLCGERPGTVADCFWASRVQRSAPVIASHKPASGFALNVLRLHRPQAFFAYAAFSESSIGVRGCAKLLLVAEELEPVETALRETLGLGAPFRDPAVAEFGLVNAVFALGDCFLEVISPLRAGTAAGRYIGRPWQRRLYGDLRPRGSRRGENPGAGLGVRVVWEIDLADISSTHLHPGDMRGAIVSLDQSRPAGDLALGWSPSGPAELATAPRGALQASRWQFPIQLRSRHAGPMLLGASAHGNGEMAVALDGAKVSFAEPHDVRGEGLVEIAVELPAALRGARTAVEVGGVRLCLTDAP